MFQYGKTEKSRRTIYIDDYAANLLREQGIGFSGHPRKVLEYLYDLQNRIGVNRFKYHALRHYYASFAHSMGIPDAYIMAAGGWSSDHVMKAVYRHAQKGKDEEMMKKISEAMFGADDEDDFGFDDDESEDLFKTENAGVGIGVDGMVYIRVYEEYAHFELEELDGLITALQEARKILTKDDDSGQNHGQNLL